MPTVETSNESTGLTRSFGAQTDQQNRVEIVTFSATEQAAGVAIDKVALATSSFELGQPDANNTDLFCQSIAATRDEDNPLVFRVVGTFVSNEFDPVGGDPGPTVQDWNLSAQAKPKDVFRLPETTQTPTQGNVDSPNPETDIGGEAIDRKGQKTSIVDVQPVVTVTVRREVQINSPGNYIEGVLEAVGTRNKGRFLGAEAGKLLLTGLTTRRVSTQDSTKTYDITFTFVYDNEFHCVQVAKDSSLRSSGVQFGKDVSQPSYNEKAFPVFYVQPFKTLANFNALGIDIK